MIKIKNVILPSPSQWESIIAGLRSPMNSWDKSDSGVIDCANSKCDTCFVKDKHDASRVIFDCLDYDGQFHIGLNDVSLMRRLAKAGTDHRKFMRMITVYVDITAPLYWWKEFDTYKVGTVANSCSTMHKIADREFTIDDFSHEHLSPQCLAHLQETINLLNLHRASYLGINTDVQQNQTKLGDDACSKLKKDIWWQMIQLLPSSYNQRRTIMMNYEVLANIYKSRKNHKLDEWSEHDEGEGGSGTSRFCNWIKTLPYSELITQSEVE